MEYLIEDNPWDNPWGGYGGYGWYPNPRKKKKRRNPMARTATIKAPRILQPYLQGVNINQVVAAGGGMWLASYVPGRFKPSPVTMSDKFIRFGYGLGSAIAAGLAAKAVGGTSAAQAAVLGGLGGTFLDTLRMTNLITGRGVRRQVGTRPPIQRIGTSTVVSPAMTREGETVSLITP